MCDPIWQMTLRSFVMGCQKELWTTFLTFYNTNFDRGFESDTEYDMLELDRIGLIYILLQ